MEHFKTLKEWDQEHLKKGWAYVYVFRALGIIDEIKDVHTFIEINDRLRRIIPEAGTDLSVARSNFIPSQQELMRAGMPVKVHFEMAQQIYWAFRWVQNRAPILQLSESVTANLVLTDPPDIQPGERLRLPFDAFEVHVPDGYIPMFINHKNEETGEEHVEETHANSLLVGIIHRRTKRTGGKIDDILRIIAAHPSGALTFTDKPADDILRKYAPQNLPTLVGTPFEHNTFVPQDEITMEASLKFVRNLAAYIEAEPEHVQDITTRKLSKKQKRRQEKNKNKTALPPPPKPTRLDVRTTLRLKPAILAAAKNYYLGGTQYEPRRYAQDQRVVVRGHWRNQPHGPGRVLRKRIWIHPYEKGDPEGRIVPKTYKNPQEIC